MIYFVKIKVSIEGNRATSWLGKSMLAHAVMHVVIVLKETIT